MSKVMPSPRAVKKFVRRFYPKANEAFIDYLLWERTAFPISSWRKTQEQIKEHVCARTLWPNHKFCTLCANPLTNGEQFGDCSECERVLQSVRERRESVS